MGSSPHEASKSCSWNSLLGISWMFPATLSRKKTPRKIMFCAEDSLSLFNFFYHRAQIKYVPCDNLCVCRGFLFWLCQQQSIVQLYSKAGAHRGYRHFHENTIVFRDKPKGNCSTHKGFPGKQTSYTFCANRHIDLDATVEHILFFLQENMWVWACRHKEGQRLNLLQQNVFLSWLALARSWLGSQEFPGPASPGHLREGKPCASVF